MSAYPYYEVSITAADGYELKGALYTANKQQPKRILIIGSAFGVPYQYYKHIAHYFAEQGVACLAFDYRGISQSKDGVMAARDILMQHWGQLDLEAVIKHVQERYKPSDMYYLGHSAGGQILGLAPSSHQFDKIILAATGVGAWRVWLGTRKYVLAAMWYLAMPLMLLSQRGDYFHSKMLGPIPVPKHAVKQWVEWAKSEDYLFTPGHKLNLSGYEKIRADIFALTISDDWYAPQSSRDALLAHYVNSHRKTQYLMPNDIGLKRVGHFGLFRKKQEIIKGIWQPMVNFLNQ